MNYWKVTKKTVLEFIDNEPLNHSSSIAFYTIFSLPAILIIVVSIAGTAFEDDAVKQSLLMEIENLLGEESADSVRKVMQNVQNVSSTLVAEIIGIGTLIFSATTVFASIQNGVNKIWGIRPRANKEILSFFIKRALSLAMVLTIGFLMMVSLVLDTLVTLINSWIKPLFSDFTRYIVTGINVTISMGIVMVVFALIFKVLPDVKIKWKDVWIGALLTTILFSGGKFLIGFYIGNSSLGSAYGAAGSLVLLLIWVYYSSLILLFGAQFTHVFASEAGRTPKPFKYAERVEQVVKKEEEDS